MTFDYSEEILALKPCYFFTGELAGKLDVANLDLYKTKLRMPKTKNDYLF